MRAMVLLPVICLVMLRLAAPCRGNPDSDDPSHNYLVQVMDQFHQSLAVYSDSDAVGNHFPVKARMCSPGDEDAAPGMDERCMDNPHSGSTCIRASMKCRRNNWAGWYFMNGVFGENDKEPQQN